MQQRYRRILWARFAQIRLTRSWLRVVFPRVWPTPGLKVEASARLFAVSFIRPYILRRI